MILCECGKIIDGCTFKCYIETSFNPSTPTVGHRDCGLIFNFIDEKPHRRYSSKIELKRIAMRLAEINELDYQKTERLLIEVDRLKSQGKLSDMKILVQAFCILRNQN